MIQKNICRDWFTIKPENHEGRSPDLKVENHIQTWKVKSHVWGSLPCACSHPGLFPCGLGNYWKGFKTHTYTGMQPLIMCYNMHTIRKYYISHGIRFTTPTAPTFKKSNKRCECSWHYCIYMQCHSGSSSQWTRWHHQCIHSKVKQPHSPKVAPITAMHPQRWTRANIQI